MGIGDWGFVPFPNIKKKLMQIIKNNNLNII